MKIVPLILVLFMLSCKSEDKASTIEMMSYNYETKDSGRFVHSYLYTLIDENGSAKIINEIDFPKSETFSSTINKDLITQIINKSRVKKESYYKFHYYPGGCYLGPIIRFTINYEDGKQISFIFRDNNYSQASKYFLFKSLYDKISTASKKMDLNKQELKEINTKYKEYKGFVYHKDTLNYPMPPPPPPAPKIDEVKFVK